MKEVKLSGIGQRSYLFTIWRTCIISGMRLYSLKFVAFFGGCLVCYLLQVEAGIPPAMASAMTGLAGSFLHFPKMYEKKGLHAAIYSGSFAGMCSQEILQHPLHVFFLSLIGTGIYLLFKPKFLGFGGKLGTVSFLASIFFLMAKSVW